MKDYYKSYETMHNNVIKACDCIGGNPCSNLQSEFENIKSQISGLSLEDGWQDSVGDAFSGVKSSCVSGLDTIIQSISGPFTQSETIYNELKTTLDNLKIENANYQNEYNKKPNPSSSKFKDSNGKYDDSKYQEAYIEWKDRVTKLETKCEELQTQANEKKASLDSINGNTISTNLTASLPKKADDFADIFVEISKTTVLNSITDFQTVSGKDVEAIVYQVLKEKGYSDAGIAAIMGNMEQECNFNLASVGDNGYSHGLCQWNDSSKAGKRWTKLKDWCNANGFDPNSAKGQCEYLAYELEQNYSSLNQKLKTSNDYSALAKEFCISFERPKYPNTRARERANLATKYYNNIINQNKSTSSPQTTSTQTTSATSAVDSALNWAIGIANDDSYGYSQSTRWGNPNYDCSSLIISAYEQAGIKVKEAGANSTRDMKNAFTQVGFEWIPGDPKKTGLTLQPGDVLLKEGSHTEMYVGDGKNVGAHMNYDGKNGDKKGNEINIQSSSHAWDGVLRLKV